MQRRRLDVLKEQGGRLCLRGKPFDGIAYEVHGNRVTANYRVTEGLLGGPAEDWGPERPRALYSALTLVTFDDTNEQFPEEGAYLDGVLFDGIAYAFQPRTGALVAEQDFHPEHPGPSREWDPSGTMKQDFGRVRPDGRTESLTWHENGLLRSIEAPDLGVYYTPEGRLRSLYLKPGCPESELARLTFRVDSEMLGLGSQGVTDAFLERLEDLHGVEYLILDDSGLSPAGLARFQVCTNLKKLTTMKNTGFGKEDVRELLAHIPACDWWDRD
jgi:YD repeat-containing protein